MGLEQLAEEPAMSGARIRDLAQRAKLEAVQSPAATRGVSNGW